MSIKVRSFDNSSACSVFTLEDGTIRMLGDSGKQGAFGFYSKGRFTVSTIADGRVTIQSIKDKTFVPPPTDMGKVVQCVTDGNTTYAINDEGKLFAWGYMRQKDHKILPFGKKIKRVVRLGWDQMVFVTSDGENVYFHRRTGDFYDIVANELATIGGLKCGSHDGNLRFYLDENSNLLAVAPKRVDDNQMCYNPVVVQDCVWAASAETVYYQTKSGTTHRVDRGDGYGYHSAWRLQELWEAKSPVIFDAIDARETLNQSGFAFLHDNNTIHTVHPSYYKNQDSKFTFDQKIKQFDFSYVLLESGIVMPISQNAWTRTDMVLAAFPEWQDDEDVVYELAKLNPRNFLCASDRLRKDLDFCKRIALLGHHALVCVDGKMRRNRELRPLKKLYDIAGDC